MNLYKKKNQALEYWFSLPKHITYPITAFLIGLIDSIINGIVAQNYDFIYLVKAYIRAQGFSLVVTYLTYLKKGLNSNQGE